MDDVTYNPIRSRLAGVEAEFAKLQEERDQAIAERDAARAMLQPFAEKLAELQGLVSAQLPKGRKGLLSSAQRSNTQPGRQPTSDMVDLWVKQYHEGWSANRIAVFSRVGHETVVKWLQERGIEVKLRAMASPSPKGKYCNECGLPLDSLVLQKEGVPPTKNGVCGLCQEQAQELAQKRAEGNHAAG